MLVRYIYLCAVALPDSALGYTVFNTNCTRPETSVNYVSAASTRGTTDILWSCLFTLFACTWTVQHLNVPRQRDGRDPGWRGDIKWALKGFWNNTKWMLWTVVAPEILLGISWGDLKMAKVDYPKLKELADQDDVPWTLTHSFFANMGGFTIRSDIGNVNGNPAEESATSLSDPLLVQNTNPAIETTAEDAIGSVELGSYSKQRVRTISAKSRNPRPATQTLHLIGEEIIALREKGILKKLPNISLEAINDKSKNDTFARIVTVTQIIWMSVQIIARAGKHLAVSQLELSVLAFSICAVIIFGLNLKKPKSVQVSCTLLAYPNDLPEEVIRVIRSRESESENVSYVERRAGAPIPNNESTNSNSYDQFGVLLGGFFFGVVHIAAWNFTFPTEIERIMWRVSSIVVTVACVLLGVFFDYSLPFKKSLETPIISDFMYGDVVAIVIPLLYILARLFMLVETFRTLCFLPPSAFLSTWASNVPHIS